MPVLPVEVLVAQALPLEVMEAAERLVAVLEPYAASPA